MDKAFASLDEALRIAKEAGLLRVVGIAADPERLPDYRALGVPVFAPDSIAARNVEVLLEDAKSDIDAAVDRVLGIET